VKVVQESLRHANNRITLDYVYPSVDANEKRSTKQSCKDDLAGAESNCLWGRREVNLLSVPFCSYAGKPNFPQMLQKKWRGRRDSNSRPLP
jgi:hypothetical protein